MVGRTVTRMGADHSAEAGAWKPQTRQVLPLCCWTMRSQGGGEEGVEGLPGNEPGKTPNNWGCDLTDEYQLNIRPQINHVKAFRF